MNDTIYERINKALTWKRIATFNMVLFMTIVVPLSVRLSQQDTENRSNAATEDVIAASPTPSPSYPAVAPTIDRVNTFFGKSGDTIIVLGNNFGDYQWASKVFVGNIEVKDEEVVRWSNGILEVQIPEGARTGKVWVGVNGQRTTWNGSLLLYDIELSAKIGIEKIDATHTSLWLEKAGNTNTITVELGYLTEPLNINPVAGTLINQAQSVDMFGKKMTLTFELPTGNNYGKVAVATLEHPQIGTIELVRAELTDKNGKLIEVYADPLNLKVGP